MTQSHEELFDQFWQRWRAWQELSLQGGHVLPLPAQLFVSRNLSHLPFPSSYDNDEVQKKWPDLSQIVAGSFVRTLEGLPSSWGAGDTGPVALASGQKKLLASWGLISPQALDREGVYLFFDRRDRGAPFVLLNSGDHLVLGAASYAPWGAKLRTLQALADELEKLLTFAKWEGEGRNYYLTSSLAQAGAGVSVVQFLQVPALSFLGQVDWLSTAARYLPFALELCSEDKSLLLLVGHSGSLPVADVLSNMEAFVAKVEDMERSALASLQDLWSMRDLLHRSLAVLRSALQMDFAEAVLHWRNLYLGLYLGLCRGMGLEQMALLPLRLHTPYLVDDLRRDLPSFVADKIFINKESVGPDWPKQLRADWLRWHTRKLTVH